MNITAAEIEKMRYRIKSFDDRILKATAEGKPDELDKALASLVGTPGWDALQSYFEKSICVLLEAEPFGPESNSESYTVISLAKQMTIGFIQDAMKSVNDAESRQRAVKEAESGKSEPGA